MPNTITLTLGATYRDNYFGTTGKLVFVETGTHANRTVILADEKGEHVAIASRLTLLEASTIPNSPYYEVLTGPTLGGITGFGIAA